MNIESPALAAGMTVALAFLALVAYMVTKLSQAAPARMVATISAVTLLLGALPVILIALYGG